MKGVVWYHSMLGCTYKCLAGSPWVHILHQCVLGSLDRRRVYPCNLTALYRLEVVAGRTHLAMSHTGTDGCTHLTFILRFANTITFCPRELSLSEPAFSMLVFLQQVEVEELMVVLYTAPPVE